MLYYIIAGEVSGDLHASNLIREIKLLDSEAQFRCWGGDLMEAQGGEIVKHYKDLAFMGFMAVIANLRTILKNIDFCKKDIEKTKPDVVILIDYPGFNLRIAEYVKSIGIKVLYYISPQVWAWKQSRVKKIRRDVDKMFVILPFEKDFYEKHNYQVDFVGHPLLDAIETFENIEDSDFYKKNNLSEQPIIALLPGSRKQEIEKMLPIMLSVVEEFKNYQFVIAGVNHLSDLYKDYLQNSSIKVVYDQTYHLLKNTKAALVTSGTATLETALFQVPEVVCYKAGSFSYYIARKIVDVKFISLVNLIMDKEIVTELLQNQLTKKNLVSELKSLLENTERKLQIANDYKDLKIKLGGFGASKKTATLMLNYIKNVSD
ncbi:MAG: lipid-A-disaccharide synthase [Bacteroidetes bacterium]|nr:lipid-A-disaccharide synthase [Bacteroidota bacterium]